ncbi:MAG: 4-hydroxy-3-methylbut-2-enyl diphosphate reductase, partial [Acidobacteriota bacterium]|nr:4-hydroxy-3-methylbut-2-enyl diphosphate reductase [Acidobacteriota bacterium]
QTLGPLIHNPQALDLIGKRGVAVAEAPDKVENGTVVIRAHGIPIQDLRGLKERQARGELKIVNATCPEVAKVHNKIKKWSPKGYFTVILGSHGHAESIAHRSFAEHGSRIVANLGEAMELSPEELKKVLVVAQTTFTVKDYSEISDYIRDRAGDCILENTICEDTWMRQDEAQKLAAAVDYVIVVGGKASSNTKHLAELARHYGKPVQYVETAAELDLAQFKGNETVGILAGASTPTWLVDEVVDVMEQLGDAPSRFTRFMFAAFGTPLMMAIGAALMTLGVHAWMGLGLSWRYPVITGTYLLAMYLLTPFLDPIGLGAKGPGRARFLERNRPILIATALASLAAALSTAASIGARPLLVVFGASLLGLMYKVEIPLAGKRWSLRSIPGSKDVLVALALGVVAIAIPVWQHGHAFGPWTWDAQALVALGLVTVLVYARTVIYDIRDMQNDQVLGKETLPILLGKPRSKLVLIGLLGFGLASSIWFTFASSNRAHPVAIVAILSACAAYPLLYLWYYHERFSAGKPRFEVSVELSFYLLGLLALV